MGAEALGRGAALVVGVERSPRACSIIHQNWENVAQAGQSFRVLKGDIITVLRRMPADIQYDVVYLDPPYQSDIYDAALPLLPRLLDANGIVMVEHRRGRLLPETVGTLHLAGRRSYGQTEISIYNHKSEQNLPVSPQ
jgi:16S rRNA (guanine966-N2)-methyltransferase